MEQWQDLYGLLQVHPQAELDIIQGAYKRLCKKYHPDLNPSLQARHKMQQINHAYEVLSDPNARRVYHLEWQRRNRGTAAAVPPPEPRVEVRERVVYINREPKEPPHGGTAAAAKALQDYFACLSQRDYKGAYALVSNVDKQNFGYGPFVEWQESVSALYELGAAKIKLFKRYDAFKANADTKLRAEEYTVTVTEKHKTTGKVQESSLSKYTVLENGLWRIYLGYRDLTPLKMQFKVAASNPKEVQFLSLWEKHKEKNDLDMGLPNRRGFEDDIEREAYRSKRYARPFSLGVFSITLPGQIAGDAALRERVLKYSGYVISQAVRLIDSVAWLGDNLFGVLLAESNRRSAGAAMRRILRTVRHDVAACFDFEVRIAAGLTEYSGHSTDELIDGCLRIIRAATAEQGGAPAGGVQAT